MTRDMDGAEKLVAQNRRARHDYFILETIRRPDGAPMLVLCEPTL